MISVVVPIYNAERYLRRCLDSVLAQSYTDWECICVDDGSPDGSGAILDEYAARDGRFRVIHQANAGVSAARNAGLEMARGEWITFVDADDWLASDYLQRLRPSEEQSFDLSIVGMYDYVSEKSVHEIRHSRLALSDLSTSEQLYALVKSPRMTGPWCKLFRRTIIREHNLHFSTDISFGEDKEFVAKYIAHSRSAWVSDYCGYYYRCDVEGSLSRKRPPERYQTEYRIWQIWYSTIRDRGAADRNLTQYLVHELYYIISDSIIGANQHGYYIPKIRGEHFRLLRDNLSLVEDTNVLRKYLITHNYLCLVRWINFIKNIV